MREALDGGTQACILGKTLSRAFVEDRHPVVNQSMRGCDGLRTVSNKLSNGLPGIKAERVMKTTLSREPYLGPTIH